MSSSNRALDAELLHKFQQYLLSRKEALLKNPVVFTQIAQEASIALGFEVAHSTVSRWCKLYEIPSPRAEAQQRGISTRENNQKLETRVSQLEAQLRQLRRSWESQRAWLERRLKQLENPELKLEIPEATAPTMPTMPAVPTPQAVPTTPPGTPFPTAEENA